jgi:hypothetical protein
VCVCVCMCKLVTKMLGLTVDADSLNEEVA